jgi:hypothetical protein
MIAEKFIDTFPYILTDKTIDTKLCCVRKTAAKIAEEAGSSE